jgi:hypothetical protein
MAYYVYRPNPEKIAAESREFILKTGLKTHDLLERAKVRVADAHEQVEINDLSADDAIGLSKMVGEAEAALAVAETNHAPNVGKLAWENRRAWNEKITINPVAMPKPWDYSKSEWLDCFRPRQNKPSGY